MMRMMKDMGAQQAAAAAAANGGKGDRDMLLAGNYGHIRCDTTSCSRLPLASP